MLDIEITYARESSRYQEKPTLLVFVTTHYMYSSFAYSVMQYTSTLTEIRRSHAHKRAITHSGDVFFAAGWLNVKTVGTKIGIGYCSGKNLAHFIYAASVNIAFRLKSDRVVFLPRDL